MLAVQAVERALLRGANERLEVVVVTEMAGAALLVLELGGGGRKFDVLIPSASSLALTSA